MNNSQDQGFDLARALMAVHDCKRLVSNEILHLVRLDPDKSIRLITADISKRIGSLIRLHTTDLTDLRRFQQYLPLCEELLQYQPGNEDALAFMAGLSADERAGVTFSMEELSSLYRALVADLERTVSEHRLASGAATNLPYDFIIN